MFPTYDPVRKDYYAYTRDGGMVRAKTWRACMDKKQDRDQEYRNREMDWRDEIEQKRRPL